MDFEIFTKYNWCHFLFQDEIENMVRQGEEHAAADLLVKERIEAVNQGKLFLKNVSIILDIVVICQICHLCAFCKLSSIGHRPLATCHGTYLL